MIRLDYQLSASWNRTLSQVDLAVAPADSLHYDLFLGDVDFRIGDLDFSAGRGWIPIIDFAVCLRNILQELGGGGASGEFEFTESDDRICFQRAGRQIAVTTTYAPGVAMVDIRELAAELDSFIARLRTELLQLYPDLVENGAFNAIMGDLLR